MPRSTQPVRENSLDGVSNYPGANLVGELPGGFAKSLGAAKATSIFEGEDTDSDNESTRESADFFVESLLAAPAGLQSLGQLAVIDPLTLSLSARINYLSALEKQTGWLQALLQRAIVAVAGEEPTESTGALSNVDEAQREEIASALRLSGTTAQTRIDTARTLTQFLPETCAALSLGEISHAQAHVIARESAEAIRHGLADHEIRYLELEAISHSEFHTPAQVANKMRTLIAKIAPREFEEVVQEATLGRSVSFYPQPHGMAQIVALLPAIEAQTVMLAIDKLARKNQACEKDRARQKYGVDKADSENSDEKLGSQNSVVAANRQDFKSESKSLDYSLAGKIKTSDSNSSAAAATHDLDRELDRELDLQVMTLDQHRADALAQIANLFLTTTIDESQSHKRPTTINLTIDIQTLLGMSENPGILEGYGAIPASIARELAADGKWRRLITDPITGNLLDYGRETYQPSQALVDFLMARDRICRFPGCRQPARVADIDHAQSWESGGNTSPENMGLLCRRHHRIKTHGGWKLQSSADGSCSWTSPTGRTYFVAARSVNDIP